MATIYLSKTPKEKLPKRRSHDFYPTEPKHVRAVLRLIPSDFEPKWILDAGAGEGAFGKEARKRYPNATIVGIEYRPVTRPKEYDFWLTCTSFLRLDPFACREDEAYYDLVIGNPPFGKNGNERDALAAERFVRRGYELLRVGGLQALLLPISFLAGQDRAEGLYRELPPKHLNIAPVRPSFTGDGKTDATEYMAMLWQKSYRGARTFDWDLDLIAEHRAEREQQRVHRRNCTRMQKTAATGQLSFFA